ncbi:unnamed protein product [Heligmosomoides polygyrus]|uniref:Protein kinase C n=1 Tax=Heligmosomoides polygyrus TaxID=6339 RepID=A0A183FH15_HELPZ|nr:unnamed protein product [Heligmosomoides polygyrus]
MQSDSSGDPRIHVTLQYGNNKELVILERNDEPQVKNYMTLTFCDFCGALLTGLMRQGLHCLACKCNFHRRCTEAPRNNCVVSTPGLSTMSPVPMGPGGIGIGAPAQPSAALELPHTLAENNYLTPTKCKICDKMLKGLIRQGLKCRDCGVNVHNKCAYQLPSNCTLSDHAVSRMSITETSTPRENLVSMDDEPSSSENIPLFRLPGQASARNTTQPKVEGWMIHFLLSNPERRLKHYWILANDAINMYNEYNEGTFPYLFCGQSFSSPMDTGHSLDKTVP